MDREDAIREINRLGEHANKMQASINAFNHIKENSYYHTQTMVKGLNEWITAAYYESQEALSARYKIEKKYNLHALGFF